MAKIVYKPLEDIQDRPLEKNLPSSLGDSKFSKMLSSHLDQSRSGKTATDPDANKLAQTTDSSSEGLETLKNIDSEYYNKGVKKKTLAESYSAGNDSKLEARLKKYEHLIEAKAKKYNLDPNLLAGLVRQESNFNPYAVSHCGAMGLGQLMPETARYLGVKDPFNAAQNLDGCAKYLKEQLDNFGGNVEKALAAYNAGPGAVKKYGGIPPFAETQNYVRTIKGNRIQVAKLELFGTKKV